MKVYIGIDPGKSGAMAVIWGDNIHVIPFDEAAYSNKLARSGLRGVNSVCCLERVGAMPGQGVVSMFRFGENFGFIRGLLQAFGIRYETVPPQKWKKEFSLGKDKKASIEVAKRLFPDVSLRPTDRCKVDNDGMAEALLMAEYARRHL